MVALSKIFQQSVENQFDGFLASFGFARTKSSASEHGFSVTYRSGQLYVNIGGTLHTHDYPYYSWLKFGEGSDEFPESDWNAAALWRIVQEVSPEDYAKEKNLYEVNPNLSSDEVGNKVCSILSSCKTHGISFLKGDLEIFNRVRSAQNKGREPYKIYTPKKEGGYAMSFDNLSSQLKKKFSK